MKPLLGVLWLSNRMVGFYHPHKKLDCTNCKFLPLSNIARDFSSLLYFYNTADCNFMHLKY